MRTYSPQEFAEALKAGQRTRGGMLYTTEAAGKKTAGLTLFKEAHHTSKDTQMAKRDLLGKFRLAEISTRVPAQPSQALFDEDGR